MRKQTPKAKPPDTPERPPGSGTGGRPLPLQVRPRESQLLELSTPTKELEQTGRPWGLLSSENFDEPAPESQPGSWREARARPRFAPEHVDDTFAEKLQKHKLGNWGDRAYFLPSIPGSAGKPLVAQRLRQRVEASDVRQVRLLLHAGVPPDTPLQQPLNRTALHLAADRGDELMCQLLLSFRADPRLTDNTPPKAGDAGRRTPMELASRGAHDHVCHLFDAHLLRLRASSGFFDPDSSMNRPADLGPDGPPPPVQCPVRLRLRAAEPGFMRATY